MNTRVPIDEMALRDFCRHWKVRELALFGSVLRDDFNAQSDIDVLIELLPSHGLSLYDWVDMSEELSRLFGRPVDLVSKRALKNPFRRREILRTAEVVYAAL